ncbi:hypothetical protein CK203_113346 [Vitis vinifera]|uniref:Uncharacterized protein n=1 Tax=Vitis vinifera TaxID=29760 RepID=A0A438C472_VITVI|nr:hypothetical protein CK203_113346 [Vitis vinifera]
MGWVAGSKGWLAEEDSKRKTGKRKKEEDRERRVLLKGEDRRSLSEALYCHGEGVYAVSLGSSYHFHASHHCFSFAWPWRSPLRPKEPWSGESEELPMPVTVLEKVQQDTALQTLHVLLLEVLPKKKKVSVHSPGYYGNKVVCPGYNN